jgi:hypothetical protein
MQPNLLTPHSVPLLRGARAPRAKVVSVQSSSGLLRRKKAGPRPRRPDVGQGALDVLWRPRVAQTMLEDHHAD